MERKLQISELSVGDWVMVDGEPAKAMRLTMAGRSIFRGLSGQIYGSVGGDIFPLPITPEILDKNGFTREWGAFTHITMVGDKVRTISFKEGYLLVSKRGARKNAFEYPDTEAQIAIPCLYVHELQHALRLAGIDKEIEL